MRSFTPHRPRRAVLAAALLAAGLGVTALGTGPSEAHAAAGIGCDPIVTLSNGLTVQMTANVAVNSASNLVAINWTLHAPAGTSVLSVVYDDTVSKHESFNFHADQAAGAYQTSVVVNTNTNGPVGLTGANYAFLTGDALGAQAPDATSATATGRTNMPLSTTLQHA